MALLPPTRISNVYAGISTPRFTSRNGVALLERTFFSSRNRGTIMITDFVLASLLIMRALDALAKFSAPENCIVEWGRLVLGDG